MDTHRIAFTRADLLEVFAAKPLPRKKGETEEDWLARSVAHYEGQYPGGSKYRAVQTPALPPEQWRKKWQQTAQGVVFLALPDARVLRREELLVRKAEVLAYLREEILDAYVEDTDDRPLRTRWDKVQAITAATLDTALAALNTVDAIEAYLPADLAPPPPL